MAARGLGGGGEPQQVCELSLSSLYDDEVLEEFWSWLLASPCGGGLFALPHCGDRRKPQWRCLGHRHHHSIRQRTLIRLWVGVRAPDHAYAATLAESMMSRGARHHVFADADHRDRHAARRPRPSPLPLPAPQTNSPSVGRIRSRPWMSFLRLQLQPRHLGARVLCISQ